MLASGRALEARASARATRDLHALLARSPRVVHRYIDGQLTTPALDDVVPGDLLMVATGEVVAVDGRVESGTAVLDESTLTGEPLPVDRPQGDAVRSGAVNAGSPFDLRVTTTAAEGTYAGIVRLVREAQADTAPFVRLADRYAALFLPIALGIAAVAWWLSGDPVRAVAVLVVATPCPLILAAPVAIVSGLSRAARRGVIVKGGGPLERLAHGTVLLFDKTGTLTEGRPVVSDIITAPGVNGADVLRLAASLDQVSPHVLATAVVEAAHTRGLTLSLPRAVVETAGQGIHGIVEGHKIRVGKASWIAPEVGPVPWLRAARRTRLVTADLRGDRSGPGRGDPARRSHPLRRRRGDPPAAPGRDHPHDHGHRRPSRGRRHRRCRPRRGRGPRRVHPGQQGRRRARRRHPRPDDHGRGRRE